MDAIILAAGRNDRLKGFIPSYMKPMIVVDGSTLIGHIVHGLSLAQKIIVVASPDNVKQLVDLLGDNELIRFVVQPRPTGPLDAFKLGLELVTDKYTVLACGDNVIPAEHWALFLNASPSLDSVLISTKTLPAHEAQRFTYFYDAGSQRVVAEKTPPPDPRASYDCWIGPVGFGTEFVKELINTHNPTSLSELIDTYHPHHRFAIKGICSDVGVPGELP